MIMVIVDKSTKWTYFKPMEETITASSLVYEVFSTIIARHGTPDAFITNRDKLFTAEKWKEFLKEHGIKGKLTTSFHP
jgi:hypothetical protein